MKKYLFCMAVALLIPVSGADASQVGINVGINVGAPAYAAPPVVITAPPEFVAPPQLGFYVAVGVPYDLFYVSGSYYLNRGNVWYSSPYYNGPWVTVQYSNVPYGLRKYPAQKIHYYRDNYYNHYQKHDRRDYRHFRPQSHGRNEGNYDHGQNPVNHGRGGGNSHGQKGR
jgi:hypothetical protein